MKRHGEAPAGPAIGTRALGLLSALALLATACAAPTTSDGRPIDVTGIWIGSYSTLLGHSGKSTLVLRQDGEIVTGTIQITSADRSFGAAPRPIQGGHLSGTRLGVKAIGADGGILGADLQLSADGRQLSGGGRHTNLGYDAWLQFSHTRAD